MHCDIAHSKPKKILHDAEISAQFRKYFVLMNWRQIPMV